jgi:glycosyltransferase involved in cell wall biosynthesis
VAMTTMNSIRTVRTSIESVLPLAGLVLVVDSGSTDGTVEIARSLGATVEYREWEGFVLQARYAIGRCAELAPEADWLFLLDSDESVDPELASAILGVIERDDPDIAGCELNRRLQFAGRPLHRVFQPEWRTRVFRRDRWKLEGVPPHYFVSVRGTVRHLPGFLRHDSWRDADDMFRRGVNYARITAANDVQGGRLVDLLVSPGLAFIKQFILRRGFLDGWRGLVASGGAAASTLMKHIAIAERDGLARERSGGPR